MFIATAARQVHGEFMAKIVDHVIVITQENHTTDNYMSSLRAWGANVATGWPALPNPPAHDQNHTRAAYAKWLHAQTAGTTTPATHAQLDTDTVLPFYAYLAKTGAFLQNHCSGFGTNSTPNHLLIVGGQTPTLRNPPRGTADPVWDMPSLPGHAGDHGLTWKVYAGTSGYPVNFYTQLKGSPNIVASNDILTDATNKTLPDLSMVWHDSPYDEHPVADVTKGQDAVWQIVDSVATAGLWDRTVFLLTWDDWGGFDDHVATPNLEHTPDNVQLAYGPRVPLLLFGGPVTPGIDSRWNGHHHRQDRSEPPRTTRPRRSPTRRRPIAGRPRRHHPRTLPTATGLRHHDHPTDSAHTGANTHTHTAVPHSHLRPRRTGLAPRRHHPAPTQRPARHLITPDILPARTHCHAHEPPWASASG